MRKVTIVLFPVVLFLSFCNNSFKDNPKEFTSTQIKEGWRVLKIEGSTLFLNNNKKIETHLFNVQYFEVFFNSKNIPYYVLAGKTCDLCDENISIYLFTLSDTLNPINKVPRFSYPGVISDYESNQIIFDSKLYICDNLFEDKNSGYLVWVQRSNNGNDQFDSSVFVVDIFKDKIRERTYNCKSDDYRILLRKIIYCNEITGINTTSEP